MLYLLHVLYAAGAAFNTFNSCNTVSRGEETALGVEYPAGFSCPVQVDAGLFGAHVHEFANLVGLDTFGMLVDFMDYVGHSVAEVLGLPGFSSGVGRFRQAASLEPPQAGVLIEPGGVLAFGCIPGGDLQGAVRAVASAFYLHDGVSGPANTVSAADGVEEVPGFHFARVMHYEQGRAVALVGQFLERSHDAVVSLEVVLTSDAWCGSLHLAEGVEDDQGQLSGVLFKPAADEVKD